MEEGKSVRIDFISVHEKGAKAHAEDLTPNSTRIVERESWAMRYIAEHHGSKLGRLPFFNDECDPQVGWWDTHTWRAKAYYPALAAKIIDQHDRWFVKPFDPKRILESGVMPYGLLSNDNGFLGCWGQRTLLARFTDTGTEDTGQTGCKNAGGRFDPCLGSVPCELIKLPILNLMSILAMLGNQRLHLETDDRGTAGSVGVLATRRGQQISVLVYASDDQIQRSGEREVSLRFNGVNLAEHQLLHYALDDTQEEGNPFQVWERLGAPEAANGELTVDMLHAMQDVQELRLAGDIDGSTIDPAGYTFTLNIPSVHLILLTLRHAPAASAPEILWSKVYPGLDGRINRMLRWQTPHEEWVRFYRVLGSNKMDGTFVPLNSDKTVLVDNGFVHRDVRQTPYFYRVEAYGYGNQPPAVSHVHVAG
jgi:L-iduronidase